MKIKGIFSATLIVISTHYVITDDVSDAVSKFTLKLFKEISGFEGENNAITSPISAQIALGLLSLGSGGSTTDIMNSALNFPNSDFVIYKFGPALQLLNTMTGVTLNIANKIYVQAGLVLTSTFQKYATDVFFSEVEGIDFSNSDKAASTINAWVEEKTSQKIKNLVDPLMFDGGASVVLINAIYFKGLWENKFNKSETFKKDFTKSSNKVVKVDFMNQYNNVFNYAKIDSLNAKALEMHYLNRSASMVILLPDQVDGIKDLEIKLTGTNLHTDVFDALQPKKLDISVPKFTIETEIDLEKILPKIGLQSIFSAEADFSNIVEGGSSLFVSGAIQKAFIEVDEEGTEATAATAVVTEALASSLSFDANHPFIFILKMYTGDIFFIGKYNGNSGISPISVRITRKTAIPWWYSYPRHYPRWRH